MTLYVIGGVRKHNRYAYRLSQHVTPTCDDLRPRERSQIDRLTPRAVRVPGRRPAARERRSRGRFVADGDASLGDCESGPCEHPAGARPVTLHVESFIALCPRVWGTVLA
jgi:hypothetical protein